MISGRVNLCESIRFILSRERFREKSFVSSPDRVKTERMSRARYQKLSDKEVSQILAEVGSLLPTGFSGTDPYPVILKRSYSFYSGWSALEINRASDIDSEPLLLLMPAKPDKSQTILVDYRMETIRRLNKTVPLKLNAANAAEYASFVLKYTRGEEGRFIPLKEIEELSWREEPPNAAKRGIASLIQPPRLVEADDTAHSYAVMLCVLFQRHLFSLSLQIDRDGTLHVLDRTLLIEDLPVQDDIIRL